MPRTGMSAAVLGQLYILVFVFLLIKIIMRRQLCQQLVRPVAYMCFRFSVYRNRNARAAILIANILTAI